MKTNKNNNFLTHFLCKFSYITAVSSLKISSTQVATNLYGYPFRCRYAITLSLLSFNSEAGHFFCINLITISCSSGSGFSSKASSIHSSDIFFADNAYLISLLLLRLIWLLTYTDAYLASSTYLYFFNFSTVVSITSLS